MEQINDELILSLIERYKQNEIPRLKKLYDYYIGNSEIKKRSMKDASKPNNKVAHPFGAYLVQTIQGYMLGKPISYSSENEDLMLKVQDIFDKNNEQSHNSELGKYLSIYGLGYELLYVNEQNEIKFSPLSPEEAFVIYDNSIEQKPLMAVRFYEVYDYMTDESVTHIELYSPSMIQFYKVNEGKLVSLDERKHYFKGVPVIPYFNNTEAMGDYERVLDLILQYDRVVSDTANNLESFSDAYLVLSGISMDEKDIATMRENKVMILQGENAKAEWLTKSALNMEIEEFKNRIKSDIHAMTSIPDVNNENFISNSGEALRYKLFALENVTAVKERQFKKSLMERLKLIIEILNIKGTGQNDHTEIVMNFQRNLPINHAVLTDMVAKLQGIVSNETLIQLLPFVDDSAYEMQLLKRQAEDTLYPNFEEEVIN